MTSLEIALVGSFDFDALDDYTRILAAFNVPRGKSIRVVTIKPSGGVLAEVRALSVRIAFDELDTSQIFQELDPEPADDEETEPVG